MTEKLVLDVKEIAGLLGLSKNKCYELIRQKQIPSLRLGKRVVVPKAQFMRFIENGNEVIDDGISKREI